MLILVSVAAALCGISSPTDAALEGFLHCVTQLVLLKRIASAELFLAVHALLPHACIFPLAVKFVHVLLVTFAAPFGGVARAADATLVGFGLEVGVLVLFEPLLAGEGLVTDGTLEWVQMHLLVLTPALAAGELLIAHPALVRLKVGQLVL